MDLIATGERERARCTRGRGVGPELAPTDVFITYSEEDFQLGLNAAQTTLAVLAQLAGASVGP